MNNENEIMESVLDTEETVTSAEEVASTETEENTEVSESAELEVSAETVAEENTAVSESAEDEEEEKEPVYPAYDPDTVWGKICIAFGKCWGKIKEWLHLPTLTRKQKAAIFDKITTGILIFLMATPVIILVYILLWFLLK